MSHRLPLSRVARLVGSTRSALQKMVRAGELSTFDGEVELDELLRVFPDVRWEEEGDYKRVTEIKEKAFGKRIFERALPDKEVLAERLFNLGKEFAAAKSMLHHHEEIFSWLERKLDDLADAGTPDTLESISRLKRWLRQQLQDMPTEVDRARTLVAEESVMRILSVAVTVQPSGHDFFVEGNDTILEAALKAGIPLNYGCSNGNCGECKARLVSGQVRKVHPHDYVLGEAEKASDVLLMCCHTPVSDVVIETSVAGANDIPEQTILTRVKAVDFPDERMATLHLTTPRSQRLRFLAGQKVTLDIGGVTGEYYIASCPCEDRQLELHIARHNQPFARRLFEDLRKEDKVGLTGPRGNFVIKMDSRRPVIFAAWGDGFSPIKSLVQHAMSLDVAEQIHLYWVAGESGHYQDNVCRAWADALDNFSYRPLASTDNSQWAAEEILALHPDLTRFDIYAAGPEGFLNQLRDGAMARGLSPLGWHAEGIAW